MVTAIVAFFAAIEPHKKTMTQCRRLLPLKCKEEGDGNNYHRLFLFCNTTTQKNDDNSCRHLLFLCNRTIEEDDGALSLSSSF